jgi:hypothetical protein
MDNRYFQYNSPALMSDGRFITNYLPDRTVEQYIRHINNIDSAQDYRLFLQKNGDTIMNREREIMTKLNTGNVNGNCLSVNKMPYETIVKFRKQATRNNVEHFTEEKEEVDEENEENDEVVPVTSAPPVEEIQMLYNLKNYDFLPIQSSEHTGFTRKGLL